MVNLRPAPMLSKTMTEYTESIWCRESLSLCHVLWFALPHCLRCDIGLLAGCGLH
jgi:hypothetical protein